MTAPLPWLKLYTKTIGDPEWVNVPADEFGCWAKMLLLAGKSQKRGFIFGSDKTIAAAMYFPEVLISRTVARFSRAPFKSVRRLKAGIEFVRFAEHYPPSNFIPGYREVYKPSIDASKSAPYREKEQEKRVESESAALTLLESVRDFPLEDDANSLFVAGLFRDYPGIDILGQLRRWAARKLDDPIRPTSRPRQQITTWMQNAVKWAAEDARKNKTEDLSPDDIRARIEREVAAS